MGSGKRTYGNAFTDAPGIVGSSRFIPPLTPKLGYGYGSGSCGGSGLDACRGEPSPGYPTYGSIYDKYGYSYGSHVDSGFYGSEGKGYPGYNFCYESTSSPCNYGRRAGSRYSWYHPYPRTLAMGSATMLCDKFFPTKMRYLEPEVLFRSSFPQRLLCLDIGPEYVTTAVFIDDCCSPHQIRFLRNEMDMDTVARKFEELVRKYNIEGLVISTCDGAGLCRRIPRYPVKIERQGGIDPFAHLSWRPRVKDYPKALAAKDFVERLSSTEKLKDMKYTYWNDCTVHRLAYVKTNEIYDEKQKQTIAAAILKHYFASMIDDPGELGNFMLTTFSKKLECIKYSFQK